MPFFELHGDPHHPEGPWLSIGQIVAWQLERAIPARRFHVEIMAVAGAALEQEHHWMVYIKRRPDGVIIYAGHYATETLGVQALGAVIEREFGLPWRFIEAPTGL